MRSLLAVLVIGFAACGGPASPSELRAEEAAEVAIVGTTLDAASGEPVAGAEVRGPEGVEARSDERGRFMLSGLEAGWSGEITARTESGLTGSVAVRPLAPGTLEVVLHLR